MGIKTVAVYSDVDKYALHVRQADEAFRLGPAPALQSYLDIDKVVTAAKEAGVQAVHPGYGFLSENADFVSRLTDEGITFIGPPASAILALGDKVESKKIARDANLNIIPGWVGEIDDEEHAVEVANEMGFPVMIKASAGGGGKGMRIAWNEAQLRDDLHIAKAEARSAFGDDALLIEKYIERARHIEFQVLGDHFGHMVYLPERDCSVQRRNQKVIEESPSPAVSAQQRSDMGRQAVALAQAVGYNSTGTVEFIVDRGGGFYFLEMNTRLQVEHPVTEAVTGLDLVEQMILIAANQPLRVTQEQAGTPCGWAMESRVYAENPAKQFMPSPGGLIHYIEPRGEGVRVDAGVVEGSSVPMHYDPMISKLVTHGTDRNQALQRMCSALDRYIVRGVAHNVPFLRAALNQDDFTCGDYATDFIPKHFSGPNSLNPLAFLLTQRQQQELCAISVYLVAQRHELLHDGWLPDSWQPPNELVVSQHDAHEEARVSVDARVRRAPEGMVGKEGVELGALEVELGGRLMYIQPVPRAKGVRYSPSLHHLRLDGQEVYCQVISRNPRGAVLQYCGAQRHLVVEQQEVAALQRWMPAPRPPDSHREIRSPMTGTVVRVAVTKGAELAPGDELVVVEAMKMQNVIRAEGGGIVEDVRVKEGQLVHAEDVLVKMW